MSSPARWNTVIAGLPGAHILQTWEWAHFKESVGWKPVPLVWTSDQGRITRHHWHPDFPISNEVVAAAMVLQRSIKLSGIDSGVNILYVPRGPLLDWGDPVVYQPVIRSLVETARQMKSIFIKMDPEIIIAGNGVEGDGSLDTPSQSQSINHLIEIGWQPSKEQVQFRNTIFLDLTATQEELLSRMKPKTRYNIRLASRKGVLVREATVDQFATLYRIYAETSLRDGFVIRGEDYYQRLWESFYNSGMLMPLIAEVDGDIVAGVIIFKFAKRAWYLYGMSKAVHREKMPNYLLQWKAITRAKDTGCTIYDLWGAPDLDNEKDPLWGVYRFKEGIGGQLIKTAGAWDYPVKKVGYTLYTRLIPLILSRMRKTRLQTTRDSLE
jgi:lipid II:glycine glycyltransferase (peptidoglycan interpeptide bridge formation enzyme)